MGEVVKIYRNSDVEEIIGCIPQGHKHLRLIIRLKDQTIVLQEATVAAIVRAYISITTHPVRKRVRMKLQRLDERKPGYADYQLLELEENNESKVCGELGD